MSSAKQAMPIRLGTNVAPSLKKHAKPTIARMMSMMRDRVFISLMIKLKFFYVATLGVEPRFRPQTSVPSLIRAAEQRGIVSMQPFALWFVDYLVDKFVIKIINN